MPHWCFRRLGCCCILSYRIVSYRIVYITYFSLFSFLSRPHQEAALFVPTVRTLQYTSTGVLSRYSTVYGISNDIDRFYLAFTNFLLVMLCWFLSSLFRLDLIATWLHVRLPHSCLSKKKMLLVVVVAYWQLFLDSTVGR